MDYHIIIDDTTRVLTWQTAVHQTGVTMAMHSAYVGQHFLGSGHSFFTNNYYINAELMTDFKENKTLTCRTVNADNYGLPRLES